MLPRIPYQENGTQYQIINHRGINLSESASDGELSDSYGVTTDNYPVITQRKKRSVVGSYGRPSSIFYWDGLLVVDGTDLIYKGNVVGNVTPGAKQFAVVNTKLVVWPDKKYIDIQDGTLRPLGDSITTDGNTTFTSNTITISSSSKKTSSETTEKAIKQGTTEYVTVYSSLSFNSSTHQWDKGTATEKPVQSIAVGDKTIPSKNEAGVYTMRTRTGAAYETDENDDGIYFEVTSVKTDTPATEYAWEKYSLKQETVYGDWYEGPWVSFGSAYKATGYESYAFNRLTGEFTVYGTQKTVTRGSETEAPVYGTVYSVSINNRKSVWKHDVSSRGDYQYYKDAIQEEETKYSKGSYIGTVNGTKRNAYPDDGKSGNNWYVYKGPIAKDGTETIGYDVMDIVGEGSKFSTLFHVGETIRIDGSTHVREGVDLKIASVTDNTITFVGEPFTPGTETNAVTVYKHVPDLDFICASDNRLWGVNNSEKTIYASALGLPGDFYAYDGLSTDSYAVAVGTDKDFTGIIAYGDSVICWKENCMHKIMGSNPAEYYMSTYIVNGVEAGSNLSMQVVNEVLYYKGIDGVYQYTGGVPQLISAAFGMHRYHAASGGSDDTHYYISMQNITDETWVLFVYDILRGLWIKEDSIRCDYFTEQDNKVLFLSENVIYKTGQDDGDEVIDWLVEYAPTYETHVTNYSLTGMLNRRDYLRLVIRVEVNGTMKAEYRSDDGPWITARHVSTDWTQVVQVPIPPLRCDKFQFRLSGKGEVTVRAVQRELTVGSTK